MTVPYIYTQKVYSVGVPNIRKIFGFLNKTEYSVYRICQHSFFLRQCGLCWRVKSIQVVGLRDRVAIIRALLHTISSPQPYAGYGDLIGVGRRRNLSEAACYRNWYLAELILSSRSSQVK